MPVAKPVIAGNWKMFNGPGATRDFFQAFLATYPPHPDRTIVFFPPAISLTTAMEAVRGRADIGLGLQNVYWEPKGAFTGETSAPMARDAGAQYVLQDGQFDILLRRFDGGRQFAGCDGVNPAVDLLANLQPRGVVCVGRPRRANAPIAVQAP